MFREEVNVMCLRTVKKKIRFLVTFIDETYRIVSKAKRLET